MVCTYVHLQCATHAHAHAHTLDIAAGGRDMAQGHQLHDKSSFNCLKYCAPISVWVSVTAENILYNDKW